MVQIFPFVWLLGQYMNYAFKHFGNVCTVMFLYVINRENGQIALDKQIIFVEQA